MNRLKILMIVGCLLLLVGCTKTKQQQVLDDIQLDINVYLVPVEEQQLLSTLFRVTNRLNEEIGPLYVNYIFNGELLQQLLQTTYFSSHKELGEEGITVDARGVYQGGDNISFSASAAQLNELRADKDWSIEIQVIDIKTEQVLATKVIKHLLLGNDDLDDNDL